MYTLIGAHGRELGEAARLLNCTAAAVGFGLNVSLVKSGVGWAVKRITRRSTGMPLRGPVRSALGIIKSRSRRTL